MAARAAGYEAGLRAAVARLEETGERAQVEDYLRPGDAIVGFARKDLGTLTSAGAADLLAAWLATFKADSMEQVVVSRGAQRVVVYVDIPEVSVELLELARTPTGEVGRGAASPAAPSSVPPAGEPSAGPLKEIEAGFARIPAGYRGMLPVADRTRLEALLQRRAGTPDDFEFLRNRILAEALPAFEKEAALVRLRMADLEANLKGTTSVDVIHFRDGRKVESRLLQESEAGVKIKARLGTITVPRADVLRVERGKGAGLEFPDRLKAAQGRFEALTSLLGWCRERNLKLEGEYVACLVLSLDPAHEASRTTLSLRHPLAPPPAPVSPPPVAVPAPLPPPPAAPRPGPSSADTARGDLTVDAMDAAAAAVVKSHSGLNEVVAQMRARSEPHQYGFPPPVPVHSSRAMTQMGNPLSFRLSALPPETAQELKAWWAALPAGDRKDFARFVGLWCAHLRTVAGR